MTPACLAGLKAATSLRWACPIQPGVQRSSLLHIPRICLWFTEQVTSPACLNSCFGEENTPPSPPNGGVKTTRAPLPVRLSSAGQTPPVTWCAAFTGDRMNNLFVEFSPSLTFRCLTPRGCGFNNIDSALLLCASSDKIEKQSKRTQYQNHGYPACGVFHTKIFLLFRHSWNSISKKSVKF